MSTIQQTPLSTLADKIVTVSALSNAPSNNITAATTGTIYLLEVDNLGSNAVGAYLKIADASSATVGTTQPKISLYIPPNTKQTFAFQNGHTYTAGLSIWATRNPGYTDNTKPDTGLTVKVLVTA
jgi:hypothetical protein